MLLEIPVSTVYHLDDGLSKISFISYLLLPSGLSGPLGDKGYRGEDCGFCAPGLAGLKGEVGESGRRGYPGLQGNRGLPGERGDKGIRGFDGLPGYEGSQGTKTKFQIFHYINKILPKALLVNLDHLACKGIKDRKDLSMKWVREPLQN